MPLAAVTILALISGYFSLMETALSESLHGRIEKLAEGGNSDAQAALSMLESPAIPLLISKAGATVAGIFSGFCAIPLSKIIFTEINFFEQAQTVSIIISIAAVIFLMILFGEFLPVRTAQQSPEKVLLEHFKSFNLIVKIFSPPVKLISKMTEGVMMIFGMNAETQDIVTEDEVKDLIEQGTEDGTFEQSERAMVDKIFQLSDQTAYALMTPRTQMIWLDISDSLEQNLKIIRENKQNVFPVGEGNLDEFRGVLYAKDLLDAVLNKKADEEINLAAVIKKPIFIPRTMETFRLVEKFKATGDSVAIVNDEYGGVVGFITLDDIAQEIVGLEEPEEPQFSLKKDNNWLVDGLYDIDDFKRRFNLETLPDEERDHFQTMGGFLTSLFGYIPKVGEFREWNNFKFRVERMDGARIDKIFVTRKVDTEKIL
ncbi:MAG: HlyC/CorC family transporter [Selenomonadaceae bacterium]|nr:HlyC/CorC family transporter [Selenomonadaceae bacterium]